LTLLNPDFRDILCALSAERTEFLVIGSYAVAVYAKAREISTSGFGQALKTLAA
jgi:hypothetical protein